MLSTDVDTTPQAVEAEEALLGSILIAGDFQDIIGALPKLTQDDFYLLKHSIVYRAIFNLRVRREHIDNLTVIEELRSLGQLDVIGGSWYITKLINDTPTWIHYESYANIVMEAARQRRVLALNSEIARATFAGDREAALKAIKAAQEILSNPTNDLNEMRQYLIHVADLEKLPPVTWLIQGQIPQQGLVMYFGPSGVGKSFIALDQALYLSKLLPVIYIAAEGENGFWSRVKAWCRHNKVSPKQLKLYFFMNVVSLIEERELAMFMDVVAPLRPALIVVDTVAHCMLPGSENDTREMGMFVRGTKQMYKKFNCAALLVHHTNKGGKVERGSGSLRNACDVIARITDDDDVIAFECSKSKDAVPFPTRYLKLLPVEIDDNIYAPVVVEAAKIVQRKEDPLTRNQQKVFDTLRMDAYSGGLSRSEIAELCEMSNGTLGRVLSSLIKFGHITQGGRGEKYTLTANAGNNDSVDSVDSVDSPASTIRPKNTKSSESTESSRGGQHPQTVRDDSVGMTRSDQGVSQPSHRAQMRLIEPSAKPATPPRPNKPCPKCDERKWIVSPLTGDWICENCSEQRKQQVLAEMAAMRARQTDTPVIDEEETHADEA